jgi:hypothetical protein
MPDAEPILDTTKPPRLDVVSTRHDRNGVFAR